MPWLNQRIRYALMRPANSIASDAKKVIMPNLARSTFGVSSRLVWWGWTAALMEKRKGVG